MMDQKWIVLFIIIFEWLMFSIGIWRLTKKLNWKKPGMTWIPGLRWFALGDSVGMNKEGTFCGVMDIFFIVVALSRLGLPDGRVGTAVALIHLICFVFLFVYRIQIFLRILNVFVLKKRWVILWLVANWLPVMIIGIGKNYQPRQDFQLEEDTIAGTDPAAIPGADIPHAAHLKNEGLSVDLRDRTVKDYRKKRYLLKDICLDIPNKSMVLLLGGSGSGKTTLVNALIGYEKANATVLLNGSDVYKDYNSVKYRIGFVPQQNLIRGRDTVIRTVNDAAKLRLPKDISKNERKEKVADVMDLLALTAGQEGLVAKKSGGQLRRISIAMELITDPELFVLDEPDSGLDGAIARELFRKLRKIADDGRIVIVITHTPDRVVEYFDKVIVLARDSGRVGRLAFYGSPDEARAFFGKDSMEGIIMSINGKEEGGEGLADESIQRYAMYTVSQKEGTAS